MLGTKFDGGWTLSWRGLDGGTLPRMPATRSLTVCQLREEHVLMGVISWTYRLRRSPLAMCFGCANTVVFAPNGKVCLFDGATTFYYGLDILSAPPFMPPLTHGRDSSSRSWSICYTLSTTPVLLREWNLFGGVREMELFERQWPVAE